MSYVILALMVYFVWDDPGFQRILVVAAVGIASAALAAAVSAWRQHRENRQRCRELIRVHLGTLTRKYQHGHTTDDYGVVSDLAWQCELDYFLRNVVGLAEGSADELWARSQVESAVAEAHPAETPPLRDACVQD